MAGMCVLYGLVYQVYERIRGGISGNTLMDVCISWVCTCGGMRRGVRVGMAWVSCVVWACTFFYVCPWGVAVGSLR